MKENFQKLHTFANTTLTKRQVFATIGLVVIFLSIPLTILALNTRGIFRSTGDIGEPSLLVQINQYRAERGLGPLVEDQNLTNAACWYGNDMAAKNYLHDDHSDSLGRTPFQRIADFGGIKGGDSPSDFAGETVYASFDVDTAKALRYWKESPRHNAVLLGDKYTRIGLGRAYSANGNFRYYWVADFASSLDAAFPLVIMTSSCRSNQTLVQSATLNASANPCLIASTETNCTDTITWSSSGYSGVYLCKKEGTNNNLVIQGQAGTSNQTLAYGKVYTFSLKTGASAVCSQGTELKSVTVNVLRINTSAGDVNCDGKIDSVDALLILRHVAKLTTSASKCSGGVINLTAADFVADSLVDATDALFVLRKVAGLLILSPNLTFSSTYRDSDLDFMQNVEETVYPCLNANVKDGSSDSDKDGRNNLAEIAAGTNPCKIDYLK